MFGKKKEKIFKTPEFFGTLLSTNSAMTEQLIIVNRKLEIEKKCTAKCDTHRTPENLNYLEILQIEHKSTL